MKNIDVLMKEIEKFIQKIEDLEKTQKLLLLII